MNINITTFKNPFSFFCVPDDLSDYINFKLDNHTENKHNLLDTNKLMDLNHGQYVAVMWKNKWARGVISMEKQFLIWLIDYGVYLRPNEKTFFKELPLEYKKIPTKVFEASIHGVVPIDKVLTDDCQLKNEVTTTWTQGAIEKSQEIIKNAQKIIFQPLAILTTLHNHIVIGDIYLEVRGKGIVNFTDQLEAWPVFLEKNPEAYLTNISKFYGTRRLHRSCMMKPKLPDQDNIPEITFQIDSKEYEGILAKLPQRDCLLETDFNFADSSTVVGVNHKDISDYKITPSDIEKYSKSYISINGREYNVLSVLVNKARDLSICEQYKDHDLKSVGRGISYRRPNIF